MVEYEAIWWLDCLVMALIGGIGGVFVAALSSSKSTKELDEKPTSGLFQHPLQAMFADHDFRMIFRYGAVGAFAAFVFGMLTTSKDWMP